MRYTTNLILTEEQMAAYFDGRLSAEEAMMVELTISNDHDLQEIQDSIDDVDNVYVTENSTIEVPLECLSEDFQLPNVDDICNTDSEKDINLFDDDDADIDQYESEGNYSSQDENSYESDELDDDIFDNKDLDVDMFGFSDEVVYDMF